MRRYRGYCIGGPLDGREVTRIVPHFGEMVMPQPITLTGEPPYPMMPVNARAALYSWNEENAEFVFQGWGDAP
jgi:hypothetical protein